MSIATDKKIGSAQADADERWHFQQLVSGVKDYAIFTLDPTGHVTSWNIGAERIKKYRSDEIIGQHFSRFYTEEDREAGIPARNEAGPERPGAKHRERTSMSAEIIELDDVDGLGAGAVGEPGQRAFYIQARTEQTQLTVLVEKEQVALLAAEAVAFLDKIADDYPELPFDIPSTQSVLREPTVPLFRARLIGLGFDPERELVLLELRERAEDEDEEEAVEVAEDDDGYVARIYATRAQVRAMAARGIEAVAGGRPPCPLCEQPMDPSGHRCPRWN